MEGEDTCHNQVVDDTPSNPLEASVHHTHDEAVGDDRNLVGDTNALGDQRPEEGAAAHRCRCW